MDKAKFFMLFSSSKGNSAYIKYGKDEILIDCGASARAIEGSLNQIGTSLKNISAIFITHEHGDHIKGLQTITKHFEMPVFAPKDSCDYLAERVDINTRVIPLLKGDVIDLCNLSLCPVPTPHDSRGSCGFRIKTGDELMGYFTDIGHLSEWVLRGLSGCNRVVIESNHDIDMLKYGDYPDHLKQRILSNFGHLSNAVCANLLPHLVNHGTRSFMLAHLSQENNRPEIAYKESFCSLTEKGFKVNSSDDDSLRLKVAPVCSVSELI